MKYSVNVAFLKDYLKVVRYWAEAIVKRHETHSTFIIPKFILWKEKRSDKVRCNHSKKSRHGCDIY